MTPDLAPTHSLWVVSHSLAEAQALQENLAPMLLASAASQAQPQPQPLALRAADCLTLVQGLADAAPHQVIAYLPRGVAELLLALAPWQGRLPCPFSVVAPTLQAADAQALVAAGVVAYTPALEPRALHAQLAFALQRHAHDQAVQNELSAVRAQLDERKWVDRAKGLLMAARSIAEDEAFKLLRGAAMHANLKLAEVSRAVIDAARWAEAVNRAGQLRMLSQRLVALAAQRLLRVQPAQASQWHKEALRRVQDNIEFLASLALQSDAATAFAAVSVEAEALLRDLKLALAVHGKATLLVQADLRAEALLQAADHLTDVLQAHGARQALAIVNLCGSQRMRAQRLAKEALLAGLLNDATRAQRLPALVHEFEAVQQRIAATPLSSPEIRAALAASQAGWQTLLRAARGNETLALVQASESLLQDLDRLTDSCEHSLQLLMA